MKSLTRMLAIMHKELLQLMRDKLTFGMIVGIPLIQLTMFGYAINTDVRELRAAVADQAGSSLSREVVADLTATQVVDIRQQVGTVQELEEMLRRGEIAIGIYLPPDFDRRVLDPARPAMQLLVDGTDPVVPGVAAQLASMPMAFDLQRGQERDQKRSPQIVSRTFYNPERRSSVNIVPALIGVILTMTMVLFTAVAIVRERERGNLELLINTPVRTLELMLGKIMPYVMIGLVQVSIILALGSLLFRVPVRGDLLDVYLISLLFIATNLSLGLLISTMAQNQFQAMQLTFFFFLPSILLSGFMFPFDGMPQAARYFSEVLPLTHFIRLIRSVMLRGADMMELPADIMALLGFMMLTLTLAVARFHKRLD